MFSISVKFLTALTVSKAVVKTSKVLFKGGSNFPGKVALKLDSNILEKVSSGYKTILITGTNGKTTTTSMIYNMIKDSKKEVITNNTGANMLTGIVSCFVENYKNDNKGTDEKYAVIEVDEANLKSVCTYIKADYIIVTNLFRDQMDRYGEIYTTLRKIMQGIELCPNATLVLNGDEALLGDLGLPNKVVYYGFNCSPNNTKKVSINADAKFCKKCKAPYSYDFITYNHLGKFYCKNCGYKRPELSYSVDKIIDLTPDGSLVAINGKEYYINQPGIYNIYNALSAYSLANCLNIDNSIIFSSLKSQKSSFGRQEIVDIDGKQVKIILVKNPAGFDQAINTIKLDKRKIDLAFILNDNYADSRDVSWIWDVDFENISNLDIEKILVSGIRLYDMAVRLKVAGFNYENFAVCSEYENLLSEIKNCESKYVYVLTTYTAMLSFRKFLYGKKYIGKIW